MAKMDKEYEARMQGMLYAANIVKEHDLEYLEKEIKRRGVIKSPLECTDINRLMNFGISYQLICMQQ